MKHETGSGRIAGWLTGRINGPPVSLSTRYVFSFSGWVFPLCIVADYHYRYSE